MKVCKCAGEDLLFPELEPIIEKYASDPGGLIGILQKTQEVFGYLPEDAMKYIAERTGISVAKIFGVATFYTQFRMRPIGRFLLLICMGTACHVNGASEIVDTVCEKLGIKDGETTEDGIFTLNIVACLGCCSLAPVMMVRAKEKEEVYGNLTKTSVVEILDEIAADAVFEGVSA